MTTASPLASRSRLVCSLHPCILFVLFSPPNKRRITGFHLKGLKNITFISIIKYFGYDWHLWTQQGPRAQHTSPSLYASTSDEQLGCLKKRTLNGAHPVSTCLLNITVDSFSDVFIMALLKALLMWRMHQWHMNLFPSLHPLHRLIRPVLAVRTSQRSGCLGVRVLPGFLAVSFHFIWNQVIFRVLLLLLISSSSGLQGIGSHVKRSIWYANVIWLN